MRIGKSACLISAFLLLCSFALAQNESATPDPEKEKLKKEQDAMVVQMLEQAIGDAPLLRLPQNRATIYAMAGDLFWKFDEKRSRDLFRSAANELLAYNVDMEKEKRESADVFMQVFDFDDPRGQIMPLVAKHDGELALELLVQTRPAYLSEAMLKAFAPDAKADNDMLNFSPDKQRVRQEIALEQQFALLAADENPDTAIKLIKDSLAKGVSYNVLQLLQKLNKKDEKKATELAGDVIRKLVDTDLAKKSDEMQAALMFLQFATRPDPPASAKDKPFKFTDAQAKEIAAKLANTFLQPSNSITVSMSLARAMPGLEKLVPEKAALLRQKQAEGQKSLPPEFANMQRQQKLWDPNSTAEDILADIPKLQNEYEKLTAYQALGNKISQIEDETKAKRLIDQIPDEKSRERALDQFESAKISRVAGAGKLEDAKKLINNIANKKTRIQKLVYLAIGFNRKGTEKDIESAKGLMKTARSLLNETPEDEDELTDLMEVVKGYAIVEPDTGFKMFEPIVDQMNEYLQASAILSKFTKRNRTFRKGELVLRGLGNNFDGVLLFRFVSQMQLLGKADLGRMSLLSDRFQRSDSRTLVKLIVVQGFLADEKKAEGSGTGAGVVLYSF